MKIKDSLMLYFFCQSLKSIYIHILFVLIKMIPTGLMPVIGSIPKIYCFLDKLQTPEYADAAQCITGYPFSPRCSKKTRRPVKLEGILFAIGFAAAT